MTAVISADPKQLVEAHKQGQAEAFDEIVRCYYEGLFAHALRRLGEPHAAEDAVQETLMRAYGALHRFNGQYHLRAWLHRILSNVCHDESARRQRELRVVERAGSSAVAEAEITDVAGDELLDRLAIPRRAIVEALAALPEPYRRAIVLRYVDDLSFQEVAAATGVTEGNARARVHRARAALRRTLTSSVAAVAWLLVLLRRAERTVVPESGSATVHASLAASHGSPMLTRVAESGLVERAASLAGSLGVAASLAVPVGVSQVADRVSPPAPPAVAEMEDTSSAPTPPSTVAAAVGEGSTNSPAAVEHAAAAAATVTTTAAPVTEGSSPSGSTPGREATGPGSESTGASPNPATSPPEAGATAPPPPPPAPEAVRVFTIDSSDLTATRSWRTDLAGTLTVTIGDKTVGGNITGVVEDEAARGRSQAAEEGETDTTSGSASAGRPFRSELSLRLDNGPVVRLVLSGTLTDQPDGSSNATADGTVFDEVCGVELGTVTVTGVLHIRNAPLASSLSLRLEGVALAEAGTSDTACAA